MTTKHKFYYNFRNFVVANGFMSTIMGQTTSYHHPSSMITNLHQNFYQQPNSVGLLSTHISNTTGRGNAVMNNSAPIPTLPPMTPATPSAPHSAQSHTAHLNGRTSGHVDYNSMNGFFKSANDSNGNLNSVINSC